MLRHQRALPWQACHSGRPWPEPVPRSKGSAVRATASAPAMRRQRPPLAAGARSAPRRPPTPGPTAPGARSPARPEPSARTPQRPERRTTPPPAPPRRRAAAPRPPAPGSRAAQHWLLPTRRSRPAVRDRRPLWWHGATRGLRAALGCALAAGAWRRRPARSKAEHHLRSKKLKPTPYWTGLRLAGNVRLQNLTDLWEGDQASASTHLVPPKLMQHRPQIETRIIFHIPKGLVFSTSTTKKGSPAIHGRPSTSVPPARAPCPVAAATALQAALWPAAWQPVPFTMPKMELVSLTCFAMVSRGFELPWGLIGGLG